MLLSNLSESQDGWGSVIINDADDVHFALVQHGGGNHFGGGSRHHFGDGLLIGLFLHNSCPPLLDDHLLAITDVETTLRLLHTSTLQVVDNTIH